MSMNEAVPVNGLNSKEHKEALKIRWQPDLKYAWDNGTGIGGYLANLKKGKITATYCKKCERKMIPPRAFCEKCYRPTDEWVDVQDTGVVNTFSICHVRWDSSRLADDEPRLLPAVIEIDGASKGMGILHMLSNVDPDDVHIGMKVKAVWKPENEREGSITDIKYWEPIK
jgi:uncharacterized OB-fold protein